jgi:hypothetical protein
MQRIFADYAALLTGDLAVRSEAWLQTLAYLLDVPRLKAAVAAGHVAPKAM